MRRLLLAGCFLLLVLGGGALFWSQARGVTSPAPIGTEFEVDFADMALLLRGMSDSEVADQLRDWAVVGTLIRRGFEPAQISTATFQAAPVRLDYLDELFLFDFGRGRRAIVSEDHVLLFVDEDDPAPNATLGRLSDQVRMEIGVIPKRFEVYRIAPDLADAVVKVRREPDVPGYELFSWTYGYVEKRIESLQAFEDWLERVDDVVFARAGEMGGVTLGGRRFDEERTKSVSLEDVAALYQAHTKLDQSRKDVEGLAEVKKRQLESELNADRHLGGSALWTQFGKNEPEKRVLTVAEAQRQFDEYQASLPWPPDAPGFSLDPEWDMPGLAAAVRELADDPCSAVRSARQVITDLQGAPDDAKPVRLARAETLVDVFTTMELLVRLSVDLIPGGSRRLARNVDSSGLVCFAVSQQHGERLRQLADVLDRAKAKGGDEEFQEFAILLDQLKKATLLEAPSALVLLAMLEFVKTPHERQCARYDGPLQGTRVGMTLFYTDLLAKLWQAIDYRHSAPIMAVPGFVAKPRQVVEPEYRDELVSLPYTRIWFGPKEDSVSASAEGETVWFRHVATRVYAAGSNPLRPGQEEQPNEPSRRSIGWWDRHFKEVADHEQEYHRQNQIMKWSTLTGWLFEEGLASYLNGVPVGRDARFDQWLASEDGLRYRHPVDLRPDTEWVDGRECLDRLISYNFAQFSGTTEHEQDETWFVEGGVSLSGKNWVKTSFRVNAKKPIFARRAKLAAEDARGLAGTAIRARPQMHKPGKVISEPLATTRARSGRVELELGKVEIDVSTAPGRAIEFRITGGGGANAEIGRLTGVARGGRVSLAWKPSPVDAIRGKVRSGDLPAAASRHPVVRFADDTGLKLVRDASGKDFVEVRASVGGASATGGGVRISLPGAKDANGIASTKLVDVSAEAVAQRMEFYAYQRVAPVDSAGGPSAKGPLERLFTNEGPGAGAREVVLQTEGGEVKALVSRDGALHFPKPSSPAEIARWRNLDRELRLGSEHVEMIASKASLGESVRISAGELPSPRIGEAIDALAQGDRGGAIRKILDAAQNGGDPARLVAQWRRGLTETADAGMAEGRFAEARSLYEIASEGGASLSPELQFRRAMADIAAGRVRKGVGELDSFLSNADLAAFQQALRFSEAMGRSRTAAAEQEPVIEVVAARAGLLRGMPREAGANLGLVADGMRPSTSFRLERPLRGTVVDASGRARIVADSRSGRIAGDVYIEDSFSVNRFGFEKAPDLYLQDLASRPSVSWQQVELPTGSYRPGEFVEAGASPAKARQFKKFPISGGGGGGPGEFEPRYAWVIVDCDEDGDGVTTPDELRRCEGV